MPEDIKPVKNEAPKEPSANPQPEKSTAKSDKAPKKDNTLKIVLIVVGVLVGLGLLGTILTVLFFNKLFSEVSDNVNVDDKNGTVTLQSDDGDTKTSFGENVKLADGFPSDVPIYEPSTLLASSKSNNTEYSAVARSASSATDVTNYYKTQMATQGWAIQYDSVANDSALLTFDKDNRSASVVVSTSTEEKSNEKTAIVVSVTTKE